MCDLFWCATNDNGAAIVWAALIGFLGALIAFWGAWRLGKNQMNILKEQAAIQRMGVSLQRRSLEFEELKVRTDVFDRRVAIFNVTREWFNFFFVHDRAPGLFSRQSEAEITPEARSAEIKLHRDFVAAADQSRFLLSDDISKALDDLQRIGFQHHRLTSRIANPRNADKVDSLSDQIDSLAESIFETERTVKEMFRREIKITLPEASID